MNTIINKTAAAWHIIVALAGNAALVGLISSGVLPNPYGYYALCILNAIHVIVAFLADPTGK